MRQRARRALLVGAAVCAAAAVAFAIGRFSAFDAAPVPNASDIGFARDMQEHHAQAVQMAMTTYRATGDEQLRALAYDIATGQSAQRGEMFDWLVQWGVSQHGTPMSWMADAADHAHGSTAAAPDAADARTRMGMATDAELAELESATGTDADCRFLTLMIRHHAGALEMTEAVLGRGQVPRVRQVAQSMHEAQTVEIDAMHAAQQRLGCAG